MFAYVAICLVGLQEEVRTKMQSLVGAAEFFCVTSDEWTSRATQGYSARTLHWVDSDWELRSLLLDFPHYPDRHTGENLCESLESMAETWGLDERFAALVTDNAPNAVKSVRLLAMRNPLIARIARLRCLAHTLQLIVREIMKDAVVAAVLKRVRSLVAYFNRSSQASHWLRELQPSGASTRVVVLIQDVPTRWSSTHACLERLQRLRGPLSFIVTHTASDGNQPTESVKENVRQRLLNDAEWIVIESLMPVLKPFAQATAAVGAEKTPSYSTAIRVLYDLNDALVAHIGDDGKRSQASLEVAEPAATESEEAIADVLEAAATAQVDDATLAVDAGGSADKGADADGCVDAATVRTVSEIQPDGGGGSDAATGGHNSTSTADAGVGSAEASKKRPTARKRRQRRSGGAAADEDKEDKLPPALESSRVGDAAAESLRLGMLARAALLQRWTPTSHLNSGLAYDTMLFASSFYTWRHRKLLTPQHICERLKCAVLRVHDLTNKRLERLADGRAVKRVRFDAEGLSDDEWDIAVKELGASAATKNNGDVRRSALVDDIDVEVRRFMMQMAVEAKSSRVQAQESSASPPSPLVWWKENAGAYPRMALAAKYHLCIVATSVPVERVFSAAGRLVDAKRSQLKASKVSDLLLLYYNWSFVVS